MLLEGAVRLDPSFAAAYAFLGRAYGLRALQFAPSEARAEERAQFAVEKALQLDPNLAEAHWARGMNLWGPRNHFTWSSPCASIGVRSSSTQILMTLTTSLACSICTSDSWTKLLWS